MANPPAPKTAEDLEEANRLFTIDPAKAEELYRGILSHQTSKCHLLRCCVIRSVVLGTSSLGILYDHNTDSQVMRMH
jgi:hypothetical protein